MLRENLFLPFSRICTPEVLSSRRPLLLVSHTHTHTHTHTLLWLPGGSGTSSTLTTSDRPLSWLETNKYNCKQRVVQNILCWERQVWGGVTFHRGIHVMSFHSTIMIMLLQWVQEDNISFPTWYTSCTLVTLPFIYGVSLKTALIRWPKAF